MGPLRKAQRHGWKMLDLLVVMAIGGIVAGLVATGIGYVREQAKRVKCNNNQRQFALACHNQNDTLGSIAPYDCRAMPEKDPYSNFAANYGSPFFHLIPYIECNNLYNSARYPASNGIGYSVYVVQGSNTAPPADYYDPGPPQRMLDNPMAPVGSLARVPWSAYICPSDPTATAHSIVAVNDWGGASYGVNFLVFANPDPAQVDDPDGLGGSGNAGAWGNKAMMPRSFPNGTANTILFAEKYLACGDGTSAGAESAGTAWAWANHDASFAPAVAMESPWNDGTMFQSRPPPARCQTRYAQTGHFAGMNVVMADGHGWMIEPSVSADVYRQAMQPRQAALSDDW
jgi:type II secretory pathway pseudopilin PulG